LQQMQSLLHHPRRLHKELQRAMQQGRLLRVAGENQPSAADVASSRALARLPFDDDIYTLAYNVFLANRNLVDARL
ncbi:hypothetical protein ACP3WI_25165, partial [Salmonella enterica]